MILNDHTEEQLKGVTPEQARAKVKNLVREHSKDQPDPASCHAEVRDCCPRLYAAAYPPQEPDNSSEQPTPLPNGGLDDDSGATMRQMGFGDSVPDVDEKLIWRLNNSRPYPILGKQIFDGLVGSRIAKGMAETGARLEIAQQYPSLAQFDSVGQLPKQSKPFAPQR